MPIRAGWVGRRLVHAGYNVGTMFKTDANPLASLTSYRLDGHILRYSVFVPKLFNLCLSLGFEPGKTLPSRAFCSDENQGYPVILIAKHFNAFPFNHGRVGGIVATDRHGPYADHGQDMVIIQASHVGFNPETKQFGEYRRLQTRDTVNSSSCGKIERVLAWYQAEFRLARENIRVDHRNGEWTISIDNQILNERRKEGLFLYTDKMVASDDDGQYHVLDVFSTSKSFRATPVLAKHLDAATNAGEGQQPIGDRLLPEWFYFKRRITDDAEGHDHIEQNLLPVMPSILSSRSPLLAAAKVNTQVEFDRVYRSIQREPVYAGRRLMLISGINIDISPKAGQIFPLTKFVPWAAYIQEPDGAHRILEQKELYAALLAQDTDNPRQIDLEEAIVTMSQAREVQVPPE